MHGDSTSIEYRDIPEFPGYRACSDGFIWTCRKLNGRKPSTMGSEWRKLKGGMTLNGYLNVSLQRHCKQLTRNVHRLVCEAFHGPCPKGHECCHGNGIKVDNRPVNLRWGTSKDNAADMASHGKQAIGSRHGQVKLTPSDVREIRRRHSAGESSKHELARIFGVNRSAIQQIILFKTWKVVR